VTVGSFALLPWISLGPSGTIEKNAAWIADKTEIINIFKELPGFQGWLASMDAPTAEDIVAALDHPAQKNFLEIARTGKIINGYRFIGLVIKVKPVLTLAIVGGTLAALAGASLNLRRLITSKYDAQGGFKIITSISILCLFLLLSFIPLFDTLGATDDIKLRLLVTLAETRMAVGAWWMLLGLVFLSVSGIGDWIQTIAPWQTSSDGLDDS